MPVFSRRQFVHGSLTLAALSRTSWGALVPQSQTISATTTFGPVLGRVDSGIAVFRGIPYGADTRNTRFQPPQPPARWTTPRPCFEWADRAPQLGGNGMTSSASKPPVPARGPDELYHLPPDVGTLSEDCLHLNVWTPSPRHDGKQRPVLVYIHGGAYNGGTVNSVLYDGTRLAQRGDVVVVTVNHRLNAFGYLFLQQLSDDPRLADSGNVGMLDLVLALQWVRDNIAGFGGDPARVTIFGQSGGGAKCATLMAMPAAHGLFHRVMTMSGQQVTAAPPTLATDRSRQFLERLNLGKVSGAELRAALEALPLEQLEAAARVSSAWLPVVDGRSLPRDPFSPDAPPISDSVPMILGNTHDETRGLIGLSQPALFSLTWEDLPGALTKNIGTYLGPVSVDAVVSHYREWYPKATPSDVFFAAATAFRSWPGQVIEAERRAQSPAQPRTWVYEMDWRSPVGGGRFGALHTVDIPFFFDNLRVAPGMVGEGPETIAAAQPLADSMSATLIAFAHTGDPNRKGLPPWPAYELQRRSTTIWDLPPHVAADPRGEERAFASLAHYRQPGT